MKDYAILESNAAKSGKYNDVVVTIGSTATSLRSTYGLWLKKGQPVINAPEVESLLECPAGFDFVYDLTQAVDGQVHYKKRVINMQFACIRPKAHWEHIRSQLETALQGQWLTFYFSKEAGKTYTGLFEVELTPGTHTATVDITVTCAA